MVDIEILPLTEHRRFSKLFERPICAEGSYDWFRTLAETTLDPGERAVTAVVFENGAAKAALPLVQRGKVMRALTAPYTTLYVPPLSEPRSARLLGEGAASYVQGSLHLDGLDPGDPAMAALLEGLKSSGLTVAQYSHFINRYEPIAGFEAYWDARPSRLKGTVRRKLTQARAESVEFRCYREHFGEAISLYDEVYRASWKEDEPHQNFMATMVENLAAAGFVRIGIMTLAKRPVAAQIWLVCGRKATIFKLAHREDAAHYSPGTLLTHWLMSTLVPEDGLNEVDFGRGDDTYKRDWLSHARQRRGVVAGNWKTIAGLRTIVREIVPTRLSGAWSSFTAASKSRSAADTGSP